MAYAHIVAGMDAGRRQRFDDDLDADPRFTAQANTVMKTIFGEGS